MLTKLGSVLTRVGQPRWLWGGAVLLAFLAGCAAPPKAETAEPGKTPAAEKSQPAKASSTAAPQRESKPAKPAPAPADKPAAAKPAGTSSEIAVRDLPAENGQPMTDAERDALAEMIRAAVIAGQKENAKEPAKPTPAAGQPPAKAEPAKPAAAAGTQTPAQGDVKAPATAVQAPAQEGCGATSGDAIDLTPPPIEQPQPKFTCTQRKAVAEGAWGGKAAEFTFTIGNDGEVPLAVRLKGG